MVVDLQRTNSSIMVKKIEKLIEKLRENEEIRMSGSDVFTGESDPRYKYYYDITGFFRGSYFSLYLYETARGFIKTKICETTDCPLDLRAYLETITDIKFDQS